MAEPPPRNTAALVDDLRRLAAEAGAAGEVLVHEERLPARPPQGARLRPRLPDALGLSLLDQGIRELYQHQVDTIQQARAGHNVVVTTPTASGKSLCFNLPVIERVIQTPGARALYLYPTKALMADQLRGLEAMLDRLAGPTAGPIRAAILSGDLPPDARAPLRADPPTILLANPDILHHEVLARHRDWERFLRGLTFVVLDELHTYRGIFGSHVALILRRLRRVAAHYRANPRFIATSATIGNPGELAEQLVGEPFTVISGEGAGSAARRFLFWRPPLRGAKELNEHRSATAEAVGLFIALIRAGRSVILFGRSRVAVERMLAEAKAGLPPALAARISAYKGGYTPKERERIESSLRAGETRGIIATNALELGIDIGGLDAAILAGYPGTVISTWQQAGRVGRRDGDEALIIFVGGDDALDQYHLSHPEAFFGLPSELAVIDPSNESVLLGHLLCAAREVPLRPTDQEIFPPNGRILINRLIQEGLLSAEGPHRLTSPESPHRQVSIRGIGNEKYYVINDGATLATLDLAHVYREAHPGAIYLHNGAAYRVQEIDETAHLVRVAPERSGTQTDPLIEIVVAPRGAAARQRILRLGSVEARLSVGSLVAEEQIVGYHELAGSRGAKVSRFFEEPYRYSLTTIGLWLDLPASLEASLETIHAAEHALIHALPVSLLGDRRDVRSTSGHPEGTGGQIYLFDGYEGGIGLCEKAFSVFERIAWTARELLQACPCVDGCPSCVHLPGCGRGNDGLDKAGALALLTGCRVAERRPPLTPPHPAPAAPPKSTLRTILQGIAAATMRDRLAEKPLAAGDIADYRGYGTVIIREIRGNQALVELPGRKAIALVPTEAINRSPEMPARVPKSADHRRPPGSE